jgi:hypothetical protein
MKKLFKDYTGSDLSIEFKNFYKKEMKKIKKILIEKGCSNIETSCQFYYFYGYFTSKTGQIYYFSCSDVRHFDYDQILYRTAKSYKDFTGGSNQYISVNLLESLKLN